MAAWILIFLETMLIPGLMIGLGSWFLKNPPKEINPVCGYRTAMSEKNQDTWDFANRHCGRTFRLVGRILTLPSAAAMIGVRLACGDRTGAVSGYGIPVLLLQTVILVLSVIPTEVALRRTFDEYGDRR